MQREKTPVISNHQVAEDTMLLCLDVGAGKKGDYRPGRFVHIAVPGRKDLILRRPISIFCYHDAVGRLELLYQVMGAGTQALAALKEGDALDVLGPLGNGFLPPAPEIKTALLVGGGIGCAPIAYLPLYRTEITFDAILGFRNQACVFGMETIQKHCRRVDLMSDDGSAGDKGFVTDRLQERLLAGERPDIIYVCGPAPMYRALKKVMADFSDITCFVSLEERMGCGVGACASCACAILRDGEKHYRRVCLEGPVFPLEEVVIDG